MHDASRWAPRRQDLTDYANDAVVVTDDQQTILQANDRAVVLLGYTLEELRGMKVRQLRDPHTLGDLESRIHEQRTRGGAVFETRYRRKDGTTFPAEVSVRVFTIAGKIHHQAILRDITHRKLVEEERAFQVKLLDALHDAVIGLDPACRVRSWNKSAERLYGWTAAEAIGRHIGEVNGTEYADGSAGRERLFQRIAAAGSL